MKKLNPEKLERNIETRIRDDIGKGRVSGAAVLICQGGERIYRKAFGLHRPGGEEKLSFRALFRLASMTKPITAAAVLLQADRGLLSLDDPVEKFLPAYREMKVGVPDGRGGIITVGKAKEKLRIFHLLTHTGGVGCGEIGERQFVKMTREDKSSLERVAAFYAREALAFEPFTAQCYSPTAGFDLLARIVEITSRQTFARFLKAELFEPLGMKDTTFTPTKEQWERMAAMHDYAEGRSGEAAMPKNCVFSDIPAACCDGGAGLASTIEDYSAFAEMLLNEGRAGRWQLLSPRAVHALASRQIPAELGGSWGFGVRVIDDPFYRRLPVGCFGWSGAYGTHFWVDPENRITAVYMKNSLYDGGSGARTAAHFEEDVTGALESL